MTLPSSSAACASLSRLPISQAGLPPGPCDSLCCGSLRPPAGLAATDGHRAGVVVECGVLHPSEHSLRGLGHCHTCAFPPKAGPLSWPLCMCSAPAQRPQGGRCCPVPTCAHLQTPRKLCLLRRGCRKSCGAVIVSCALQGFPWLCPGSLGSAAALWYGWFPARGCTPWIYSRHGAAPTAPVLWHPPPWPGSSLSSMVGVLLAAWGTATATAAGAT